MGAYILFVIVFKKRSNVSGDSTCWPNHFQEIKETVEKEGGNINEGQR